MGKANRDIFLQDVFIKRTYKRPKKVVIDLYYPTISRIILYPKDLRDKVTIPKKENGIAM